MEFHTPIIEEFSSAFFFVFYNSHPALMNANEKDTASMSYNKHEATASNYQFKHKMYLQSLMTVHVRWPGQTSGAFGLALIFFS